LRNALSSRRLQATTGKKTVCRIVQSLQAATSETSSSENYPERSFVSRSRHWKDAKFFQQKDATRLDRDLKQEIDLLGSKPDGDGVNDCSRDPVATAMHRDKNGNVVAVEISSALSEWEGASTRVLARDVRKNTMIAKTQFVNRSFGQGKGGNDCTYLAPLLQAFLPTVAAKVVDTARLAWKVAGWKDLDYPDPRSLGIRTSEHLSYNGWRSLEAHKDVGSVYTTMVALVEPQTYDGGEFFVNNLYFEPTDIKPDRLSAVVFLSDTTHGVRPITKGTRETFVTELWENDDSPLGLNRPTPERWEEYILGNIGLPFD
jgi:hypothetical protein